MRQLSSAGSFLDRLPLWLQAALHDRFLWGMVIVALLVNVGLFAFILLAQGQLPPLIPLHFDSVGQPDRIEPKSALFSLPQIGLLMIVVNFFVGASMYRREPLTSYLLGGVAIAAQFLFWFATITIIRFTLG